ncbi:AfsR/SARP family transcriptional regulator [Streptomyces niveus]|uniref:AfsR/SARP family transcriptional regulator n=1 Tax=Streptomyces niveus TaxID=193462 RepID=UPI00368B48C3
MRFQLLGPVMGFVGGRRTELGSARQRCLLAALLVDAGHVVPIEQLIDRVWGEDPPRTARGTLYSYVTRLRSVLGHWNGHDEHGGRGGGVDVTRHAGGYVLETDPEQIDVHCFRRLVARSRAASSDEEAGPLLRDALALWRDDALSGLSGAWAEGMRTRLDAERIAALLHFNDIQLRQGACEELLPDLRALVELRPLDERLAAQLMTALYRSSCQAEALELYDSLRRRLAAELGVDPDPDLQELHRQVLGAAPELRPGRSREAAPPRTVPRQLPLSPPQFVGRSRELAAMDELLAETPGTGRTPVVSAVTGMAGVGKTWLALHWAYRHLDQFPDGQVHVDLRGFDRVEPPVAPEAALRRLLDALGAAPAAIPADPDSQAGLYRSLVAGKRLLIVLDNARDTAQIVPLLPGSPTCTVLITSRHVLAGLHTHHAVRFLVLEPLEDGEARSLLAGRLGPRRIEDEARAVSEFLAYSAGLPLALGILATRAMSHPDFPLSAIADELHRESTRLDALDTGDLSADLRAVFASSYSALDAKEARFFGLLGLVPGPEIGLEASAALADLPVPGARTVLNRLVALHLLQRQSPLRYRMHDLVRLFAAERGQETQSADAADQALRRFVDSYVRTALHADRLLSPYRQPIELPPTTAEGADGSGRYEGDTVSDVAAALSWFDDEQGALAAVQRLSERHGWYEPVWQLAWASETFRLRQGHNQDNLDAWRRAITAAERLGDIVLSTHTGRYAGRAFALAGEYGKAVEHLSESLRSIERTGDSSATALTHHALGWAYARLGDYGRALVEARRNLRLIQSTDNPVWTARALNSVGWYLAQSGSYRRALVRCEQALDLFRRHDQHNGVAAALDSLGYISCQMGGYTEAVDRYREALDVYVDSGDRREEANTLTRLGEAYRALGRPAEAAAVWNEALAFYRTQHRSDLAEQILAELKGLQLSSALEAGQDASAGACRTSECPDGRS